MHTFMFSEKCACVGAVCRKVIRVGKVWDFRASLLAIPPGCVCKPTPAKSFNCKVFVSKCQRH